MSTSLHRCVWANASDHERAYHDREWGVPVHDDRLLFEFLVLEGAQAGLSWSTILNKRNAYRRAFDQFDANKIAYYSDAKLTNLLNNSEIVRNRLKIKSAITNARAFIKVQQNFGSFDQYIWQFVDYKPQHNKWKTHEQIPARTDQSIAMSKSLKQQGFSFVGEIICYAFMQATGMINDHTTDCYRYQQIKNQYR